MKDEHWIWLHVKKWPGTSHYDYQVLALGEDAFGKWFGRVGPTPIYRDGNLLFEGKSQVVILIPADGARWKSSWYYGHPELEIYVDIIHGLEITADAINLFDVDLDVVKWRDGRVEIVDIEEFEEHKVALDYPPAMIEGVFGTAAVIKDAVEGGVEPFGRASDRWFDALLERGRTGN